MKKKDLYVYGRNVIIELLQHTPHEISELYVRNSITGVSATNILYLAKINNVRTQHISEDKLTQLAEDSNHQGVVARIAPFTYHQLGDFLESPKQEPYPCVLILDSIQDIHNFGAIIRSATAAGIDAIIVGSHKQSPVNGGVFKTSAGTIGRIPIVQVKNIQTAIKKLKETGFWIFALDSRAEQSLYEHPIDTPIAFVVGNEGKGIHQKVLESCDIALSLPLENGVESLNASVAASLVVYEWRRQMGHATMNTNEM